MIPRLPDGDVADMHILSLEHRKPATVDRRAVLARGSGLFALLALGGCGGGGGDASATSEAVTVVTGSTDATPTPTPTPSATPTPTATDTAAADTADAVAAGGVSATQFGVNCYDLFYQRFATSKPADPVARLQALKKAGISVVRFSASPFWPTEWKRFDASRETYLAFLDTVFAAAEQVGVKLVPTAIWAAFALSDYMGEAYSAWGNPASKTRAYMASYVPVLVKRYANSKALLAWEFTNEMNAYADLPNGETFFPPVSTSAGTPSARTAADRITAAACQSASAHFTQLVRQTVGNVSVSSGADMPLYNQIHLASGSWDADNDSQIGMAMSQSLAGGANVLSVHLYTKSLKSRPASASTYLALLKIARAAADAAGAKLMVGEFGVATGNQAADKITFAAMLSAMRSARVDYAMMWNYDWPAQTDWNVDFTNARSWMLGMLT